MAIDAPEALIKGAADLGCAAQQVFGADTRLDRALLADGQDVRYFYGQELLPVKVTRNGIVAAEYQWHDTLRLRRHKDAMSGLTHEFVYGDRRVPVQCIVSGTKEAVYNATGLYERSLTLNVWTDQVDSIRVLSLPDGRPVKCIEYDAFGNVAADTRPEWKLPLGFACGLNDHFTGLVRFGFRDYDPRFGRFTAKDPAFDVRGDGDLWDYCIDDPVGRFDPSGLWADNFVYGLGLDHPGWSKFLGRRIGGALAGGGVVGEMLFPDEVNSSEKMYMVRRETVAIEEKITNKSATTEDYSRLKKLEEEENSLWKKYGKEYKTGYHWVFPDSGYAARKLKEAGYDD